MIVAWLIRKLKHMIPRFIIIGIIVLPNWATGKYYLPLGSTPVLNVTVLSWTPFYIYPQIPSSGVDHKSDDTYVILVWRLGPTGLLIPYASPGDASPKYGQTTFIRGQDLAFTDPHANTWGEKFGDEWMLIPVIPGYIGVEKGTYIWTTINVRTGKEWEILRINQSGHIECDASHCYGVPEVILAPPKPPSLF